MQHAWCHRFVMAWFGIIVVSGAAAHAEETALERVERELAETRAAVRALEAKQPTSQGTGPRFNPDMSLDGLFAAGASTAPDLETLQTGAHDPNQRGFTAQNLELTLSGNVDPYFAAIGHLIFGIDREGESFLEVEEAYITSTALPANLQLRAGQFFTQFGRLNPQHPHAWAFVDQPLINGRLFGGDGMRGLGMQVAYLLPLPVYAEALIALQNSQGETMFSFRNAPDEILFGRTLIERRVEGIGDLAITPRLAASFNPSDAQTVLVGVSGAFGPNSSGESARTQIYGIDLYYKWKPVQTVKGWPFVAWQTELMRREYENAADGTFPEEQLRDRGGYTQVTWGFTPRWVAGLRGEYVVGENGDVTDPLRERRVRVSPNLTFYPSEYSKWRVQYNRDDVQSREDIAHSAFLQWEFLIGAHGAHAF
ncbi:MAG: zinc-regulated TonB-dependent outer membrane receptor [Nitrospirota bacterium]